MPARLDAERNEYGYGSESPDDRKLGSRLPSDLLEHPGLVATIFTVSVASVVRWSQRLRRTGSAAGGKMGGHRACTLIGERGWLMERIAAEPEVTVRGLMTELAERGVAVSYGTFIHREGMSFKKKRAAGRARSPRRGAPPGALEKISSCPSRLHR